MELLEPIQRVGHQEVAHLPAAEVEYVSAPVELLAAPGVGMLVERGAVEPAQRPCVLGEVRRYPVHDDTDTGLVQRVDKRPEIVGCAESRCRRVVGRDLISPRSGERMLGDRQQLDVGKALCHNIIRQLMGKLAIAESGPPRAEMDLVGAHRLEHRVALGARASSSRRHPRCSCSTSPAMRCAVAPRSRRPSGRPVR